MNVVRAWVRRMVSLRARLTGWLRRQGQRLFDALEPATRTAGWMERTLLAGMVLIGGWMGLESLNLPWGFVADFALGALAAWLLFGLAQWVLGMVTGLLVIVQRVWTRAGLAGGLVVGLLLMLMGLTPLLAVLAGLAVGMALALAGAGLGLTRQQASRPVAVVCALVPAALALTMAVVWLTANDTGEDPVAGLVEPAEHDGQPWDHYLEAGPYAVSTLTYGSGKDRWRTAYSDAVAWVSEPVDARDMLGRPSGFGLKLREKWWGFGLNALPLNGRVWYPENGRDPLPLVLVVHGNHDMMHFSDPGYAWLGEHLASRGHVVVSVDQNFINGGMFGGVNRENAVRGWLLLEHLAAWREWQRSPSHPLHPRVDLTQVVLVGHSRGGEAVALATAYNRLARYPEDARIGFDYGFGIQGVAAIAPVDGQFWTSGKPTELDDVSYFVIHGGMDADVYYFSGDRQWIRTEPDAARGRFSASLYVHHANHGQFNTVWGDNDWGSFGGRLLNRAGLIDGEAQRRVGRLYLTAFVEQALARPSRLPELFCRPRAAGRLLPETLYVARCDDGRRRLLADFEQRLDITAGSMPGIGLQGIDLDLWREADVGFRGPPQRRQTGVFLGWNERPDPRSSAGPAWRITLDDQAREALMLSADSRLWLDLAQADRDPPPRTVEDGAAAERADEETGNVEALRPPINATVMLVDRDGREASRPLSDFGRLLPPLPVRHARLERINRQRFHSPTEPVLQSLSVPLAPFQADGVDVSRLAVIELRFDATQTGMLIIERVAVEPDGGGTPAPSAPGGAGPESARRQD